MFDWHQVTHAELLVQLVSTAPVAFLIVDGKGLVAWANPSAEALLGFSSAEVPGITLTDLVNLVPTQPRTPSASGPTAEGPQSSALSCCQGTTLLRAERPIPVEVQFSPLAIRETSLTLVTIRDISEQLQHSSQSATLQAQIQSINRLESAQFLAGSILHDFNNILTAISGHAELALVQDEPQERKETLESIFHAARRGATLIRRLRGVPIDERQRGPATAETAAYASIAGEALALLRGALPKNILLDWSLDPTTPAVPSAETDLHQVVMNLGMNAAEAMMPAGGHLRVSLNPESLAPEQVDIHPSARAGCYAKLTVHDDGCGMDEATLRQAFVPFFSTKTQLRSSGLGLAVVSEIVTRSKGFLTVNSKVGEGTQICVYLPTDSPA